MRLSIDQIMADKARMEQFVAQRIPGDGTRIDFGNGAWAELIPCWDDRFGWDLLIETDEPEWVDLLEVYRHFRRKEMTSREWWAEFEGEMNRSKVRSLEREITVLRQESDYVDAAGQQDQSDGLATVDENGLPREVSSREAARILGVSKDTVLKLKAAGLLEYRNLAPPTSSRAVFRFLLASVLELRKGYLTDFPTPPPPSQPQRRRVRQGQQPQFKHLRLD